MFLYQHTFWDLEIVPDIFETHTLHAYNPSYYMLIWYLALSFKKEKTHFWILKKSSRKFNTHLWT